MSAQEHYLVPVAEPLWFFGRLNNDPSAGKNRDEYVSFIVLVHVETEHTPTTTGHHSGCFIIEQNRNAHHTASVWLQCASSFFEESPLARTSRVRE
jgi:hypothetical protein